VLVRGSRADQHFLDKLCQKVVEPFARMDKRDSPRMRIEPIATYRLQLYGAFNFDDAAGIIDYLAALGISHLYSSPCLAAAPGSTHGYDVVNYDTVNPELGGRTYTVVRGAEKMRDEPASGHRAESYGDHGR
jgi:4-alpha-glucanotransferase/(1->4)-alpha-D-glucan 1-alpha-D-glucosylmutase